MSESVATLATERSTTHGATQQARLGRIRHAVARANSAAKAGYYRWLIGTALSAKTPCLVLQNFARPVERWQTPTQQARHKIHREYPPDPLPQVGGSTMSFQRVSRRMQERLAILRMLLLGMVCTAECPTQICETPSSEACRHC